MNDHQYRMWEKFFIDGETSPTISDDVLAERMRGLFTEGDFVDLKGWKLKPSGTNPVNPHGGHALTAQEHLILVGLATYRVMSERRAWETDVLLDLPGLIRVHAPCPLSVDRGIVSGPVPFVTVTVRSGGHNQEKPEVEISDHQYHELPSGAAGDATGSALCSLEILDRIDTLSDAIREHTNSQDRERVLRWTATSRPLERP